MSPAPIPATTGIGQEMEVLSFLGIILAFLGVILANLESTINCTVYFFAAI